MSVGTVGGASDGTGGGTGGVERRWTWVALVVCGVLYLFAALFHLFVQKPYTNGDEKRHVQYVVVLETKHRLPRMKETRGASHPPAYYWLQAATGLDGIKSADDAAPRIAKAALISIAFGLVAVIYGALTLLLMLPRHRGIAIFGGALIAILPTLPNNAAAINNDAMALACQLGMVYAALTVLVRGPHPARIVHCAVWMCLGALTRVSVVAAIPIALLAVFLGALFHATGSTRRRLVVGVASGAALVAAVAAAAGWFYLRNDKDLGSADGTDAILADTRNHPVRPFLSVLFDPEKWLEMQDELWGRFAGGVYVKGALRDLGRILAAASIVGAAVTLIRARAWEGLRRWRTPMGAAWLLLLGTWAAVFLPTIHYHAKGGGLHQRYLYGALPVIVLVLALGVAFTRHRTVVMAAFTSFYFLAFGESLAYAGARTKKAADLSLASAMENNRLTEAQADLFTLLFLVAHAIGLVLLLRAIDVLHRPLVAADFAATDPVPTPGAGDRPPETGERSPLPEPEPQPEPGDPSPEPAAEPAPATPTDDEVKS